MTKKTIYFILLGVTIIVALLFMNRPRSVVIDDISVSYPVQPTLEQIPVKVTLTKFQLKKMLDILEQEHNFTLLNGQKMPALDQDVYTFKSVAKGVNGEFTISSTRLSKKYVNP
tara:strand:- start:186 stop:527 length:342 start_codon:yes stop_codon:yes gene_type:complete